MRLTEFPKVNIFPSSFILHFIVDGVSKVSKVCGPYDVTDSKRFWRHNARTFRLFFLATSMCLACGHPCNYPKIPYFEDSSQTGPGSLANMSCVASIEERRRRFRLGG